MTQRHYCQHRLRLHKSGMCLCFKDFYGILIQLPWPWLSSCWCHK